MRWENSKMTPSAAWFSTRGESSRHLTPRARSHETTTHWTLFIIPLFPPSLFFLHIHFFILFLFFQKINQERVCVAAELSRR